MPIPFPIAVPTPILATGVDRYLFENPWPLALVLIVATATLLWKALSGGDQRLLYAAGCTAAGAIGVFVLAATITTPAERAVSIVRDLVRHAERGETSLMLDAFSPKALMHYSRPENPGMPIDEIRAAVASLDGKYRMVSNRVTQLDGTTESDRTATVLLSCFTELEDGLGETPTSWWFKIAEQYDGSWRIERMAFLKVAGRDATPGLWR